MVGNKAVAAVYVASATSRDAWAEVGWAENEWAVANEVAGSMAFID
jgi:hypothetical protein